jgi:hypothetical protein
VEIASCAGSVVTGADASLLLEPSCNPCCSWGEPPNHWPSPFLRESLDFGFDALLLVMSQRQLIGQLTKDWSRPAFKG